jgi:hypothetical protein
MLIMYRGFELVPVKTGQLWQAQISSGGRRVAVTPAHHGGDERGEKNRGWHSQSPDGVESGTDPEFSRALGMADRMGR